MRIGNLLTAIAVTATSLQDVLGTKGTEFKFETEVNQVMDIIIHSLYKTKDVFLRELISNSADALDKIRLASLTDKEQMDTNPELKIYISTNKDEKTLSIRDTGIGMTSDQLRDNLGTIAKSGTAEFLKTIKEQNTTDPGLIGKFGVGFYSSFLVADSVAVVSKNNGDEQHIWESSSQSSFRIIKDPRGNTLKRGTEIVLRLKEGQEEFLETSRLKEIIAKHSEFINFPIYLWTEKTIEEPIPEEETDKTKDASEKSDDSVEDVEDVTENTPKEEKPKTITKTVQDWELLNENKPIWTRNPSDVTVEEYHSFYKAHFKQYTDPLAYSHFKIEGDRDFNVLLYVPATPPPKFLQAEADVLRSVQLFVRRVFITDDLIDFLPKWFEFLNVIVDSDDLPLNVSRETLQNHASLKMVKNKIISKALDLLLDIAGKDSDLYKKIHEQFGKAFRYGLLDAKSSHGKKIMKLLRFQSSTNENVSLEDYQKRMKKGQPQIYFSAGNSAKAAKNSPFSEKAIARGYEVLFFLDPLEEHLSQDKLSEFDGIKFQNVAKAGLKFGDEDEDSEKEEKEFKEKFSPLTDWLKEKLEKYIDNVSVSSQLTNSACVVVPSSSAGPTGLTASQERMFAFQYMGRESEPMYRYYMVQKKALEINPKHPLMVKLLDIVEKKETEKYEYVPKALYELYAVSSGWDVRSPQRFIKSVEPLLKFVLGVDLDAKADVDVAPAPESDATEAKDKDSDEKPAPVGEEHIEL